jgi:Domain of unknown function (DUF4386)
LTRTTNARTAGVTFIVYFAAVMAQVAGARDPRLRIILTLIGQFSALVLAVTLYALTREYDGDLAMLGLVCRTAEGIIGATLLPVSLAFGSTTAAGAPASPVAVTSDLTSLLASVRAWNTVVSALFFAVGSASFAWVMLRGRVIPTDLAWLGVVASALMVVALPLQLAGVVQGRVLEITSLPIVFFELPLGVWLIAKGVPARHDGEVTRAL